MSLRSNREVARVADIELNGVLAITFVSRRTEEEFLASEMAFYATCYAVQCFAEAAIRLERETYPGRFEQLFIRISFEEMLRLGNRLRHAYNAYTPELVLIEVQDRVPPVVERAGALLAAYRKLHGAGSGRFQGQD